MMRVGIHPTALPPPLLFGSVLTPHHSKQSLALHPGHRRSQQRTPVPRSRHPTHTLSPNIPPLPAAMLQLIQIEEHAAKAHDVMAIRCRGTDTVLNFVADTYSELLPMLLPSNGRRPLHRVRGLGAAGGW